MRQLHPPLLCDSWPPWLVMAPHPPSPFSTAAHLTLQRAGLVNSQEVFHFFFFCVCMGLMLYSAMRWVSAADEHSWSCLKVGFMATYHQKGVHTRGPSHPFPVASPSSSHGFPKSPPGHRLQELAQGRVRDNIWVPQCFQSTLMSPSPLHHAPTFPSHLRLPSDLPGGALSTAFPPPSAFGTSPLAGRSKETLQWPQGILKS